MSAAPASVIDALNGLLEAEINSVFRFMGAGSPYLGRASGEVRRPLAEMVIAGERRAAELADMIDALGGNAVPSSVAPEEQYLAYLSLKFLLPKLVSAKQLAVQRYANALKALNTAPPEVKQLLQSHLRELQAELQTLDHAAADVAKQK
jgi:hypothetical protein